MSNGRKKVLENVESATAEENIKSFGEEFKRLGDEMSKLGKEAVDLTKELVGETLSGLDAYDFSCSDTEFTNDEIKMASDVKRSVYNLGDQFSLDSDGKNQIIINVISADITMITEEREDMSVHYIKCNPSDKDKFQLIVEEDSKKIMISEKKIENKIFGFDNIGKRELLIRMPRKYKESLSIKTVSGDLEMNYLDSDSFRYASVSGDLTADIIYSANTMIKTTSGDCEIGLFRGHMMFSSVSGDIELKYEKLDSDFTMKSVSGDAEISLPKNSEFEVITKTVSGDLNCEFPLVMTDSQKRGKRRGWTGSDKHKLRASTTSGDLSIKEY